MIAFKEWSLICDALAEGRQSLILRKGGIAEGRGGFWWKHEAFALFPTHFHEQEKSLKDGAGFATGPDLSQHTISLLAKVEWKEVLHTWDQVRALDPFHLWNEAILRERFDWKEDASLSLAVLRVYRLPEPVTFPDARGYGGCRSWVEVPVEIQGGHDAESAITRCEPVISDAEHERRRDAIRAVLADISALA